jgi:hypothetical protein
MNMADKKQRKPHKGHSQHLCAMIAGGSGYAEVKTLVKKPKYICARCARAARKKASLCKARKL